MSASGLIVFRLFSGPHMGAELVLPAGNQLVGSDDSCDIILQDSSVASRHANIVIGFSGDGAPSVRVTPLDGEILLNGAPLPSDGADIPARTPFFLGLTCMAWSEPGEPADAWRQVASGLQERRSVQERPEPAEPQREEPVMDLGDPMILLEEGTSVGAMRKRESRKSKLLLTKTVFAHWSYLRRMKASACRESCATMPKGPISCAWHKVCSTLFILM